MRRPLLLAFALTAGWTLACSGIDDKPRKPKPEPVESGPVEAPNAAKCKKVDNVSLPLSGGVITKCEPDRQITIAHENARAVRWDYADAFKKKGWSQGDPVNSAPAVVKGMERIIFSADKESVIVKIERGPQPGN